MLDQSLALFGITPDYDLNIMSPGQTLSQVTARAVEGLDHVITQEKPDVVQCRVMPRPHSAARS